MIVVFGASGHAKEVASFLQKDNCIPNAPQFLIDNSNGDKVNDIPVISENDIAGILHSYNDICIGYIAIGNALIRKKIDNKFSNLIKFENLLSNQNPLNDFVNFGIGNLLFPGVILTTNITIGNHNHFNLSCSVSHDCVIGSFNTFSPGVRLAGNVQIGNFNSFGINSSIIDGITITDNIIIGAGAVVVKDIVEPGTYVGVPAKRIK